MIAGASSLITGGMPYKLGLIVSALAGILTGLAVEYADKKRQEMKGDLS